MALLDSADFVSITSDIGETVTIYNPTQTVSTDYASLLTDTNIASGGTSETAFIQPIKSSNIQRSDGKLKEGDCKGFFKSASVIAEGSLVTRDSNLYVVQDLKDCRTSDTTHHFECYMIFLRSTA